MTKKIQKSSEDWQEKLSPEQYRVCREKGTERAFTGEYWNEHRPGLYHCVCCNQVLFLSENKFDSGSGWPSFTQPAVPSAVAENVDATHGLRRVEVVCQHCDAHLGHVFPDGPKPTGFRYCINSAALRFDPKES